ncbi:MAG TPA: alkaline phosphatase family protein [Rhodocyclaceae bacterium]|nr:alkaline phosphatase family protein [Rhodocyclaceae bacterium]
MSKVILVLSDGLRYDTAVAGMGTLGHLVEAKLASRYKVTGELPSLSRPMYETVHTGLPSSEHGIVSNQVVRLSTQPNVFRLAVEAGRTTAAAAYYWFSELYNRAPYDRIEDCEVDDDSLPIQHGRFYTQDEFPDADLFAAAGWLARRFEPDYLLVHPMGMDTVGGIHGADSSEYRNHAIRQDGWLSTYLVEWMQRGYAILVSADHGVNADGLHGGTLPEVREVPLYLIRPGVAGRGDTGETVSQLQIAPTICNLLGIKAPGTMKAAALV